MDTLIGAIFTGIFIIFVAIMYFFDPLEKYDKNLDDPDYKKFEGVYRDLRLGPWPQVSDKRRHKDEPRPHHIEEKVALVDEIAQFTSEHRLPLYHQALFVHKDAVKFLYLLKKHRRKLYGFDGFHLRKDISPKAIQIDQSYSPDYSHDSIEAAHDKAVEFFERHREEDIGYEFVYDKHS